MKAVPLDKCTWCNGSGDDGGGYGACPDCESTGYKYGRSAEAYIEYEMDIVFNWNTVLTEIVAEEFGYLHLDLIPKQIETFLMDYFVEKPLMAHPPKDEILKIMLDELGSTSFFKNHYPVCYGEILKSKRILIYLGRSEPPEETKEKSPFLLINKDSDVQIPPEHYDEFMSCIDPFFLSDTIIEFHKEKWSNLNLEKILTK